MTETKALDGLTLVLLCVFAGAVVLAFAVAASAGQSVAPEFRVQSASEADDCLNIFYSCIAALPSVHNEEVAFARVGLVCQVDTATGAAVWEQVDEVPFLTTGGTVYYRWVGNSTSPDLQFRNEVRLCPETNYLEISHHLYNKVNDRVISVPLRYPSLPLVSPYMAIHCEGKERAIVKVDSDDFELHYLSEIFGDLPKSELTSNTNPWPIKLFTPSHGSLYFQITFVSGSKGKDGAVIEGRKLVAVNEDTFTVESIYDLGQYKLCGIGPDYAVILDEEDRSLLLLTRAGLNFSFQQSYDLPSVLVEPSDLNCFVTDECLILFTHEIVVSLNLADGRVIEEHEVAEQFRALLEAGLESDGVP